MSDFRGLRGFALARESAFFKLEQEADIQRHRSRLVTQGRIEDIAGGYLMPRRQQTLAESAQTFEVLAEVLQQQVRLDDPTAAQRQKFLRRVRSQLPKLTESEMRIYRSSIYGVAAIGQIPRVNLGRDRFVNHRGQESAGPPIQWSPQAREAARRAFSTGVRSLLYGSILGGVAAVLLVAVVARALDIGSAKELRLRVQENGPQAAEAFREWLLPLKTSIQAVVGPPREYSMEQPDSEFRRRLGSRFASKPAPQLGRPAQVGEVAR